MNEAIRNPVITNCHHSTAVFAELPGEVFTRRVVTVVLAASTALTFAFGFGNVWALGRSLGVPPLVAPLVGPAVDLSVAGLLIGIWHLSMAGVPRDQLRPARILLTACGAATLALNIAGPVTVGAYGRAAFDSVGPGLLIGWPRPDLVCSAFCTPIPTAPVWRRTTVQRRSTPSTKNFLKPRSCPRTTQPPGPRQTSLADPTPGRQGRTARRGWTNSWPMRGRSTRSTAFSITGQSPPRPCASRCGSFHARTCARSADPRFPRRGISRRRSVPVCPAAGG
jgi:hypothetical protein